MYLVTGAHEDRQFLRMSLYSQGSGMHNKYMYVRMLPQHLHISLDTNSLVSSLITSEVNSDVRLLTSACRSYYWSSGLETCVISLTTPGVISEVSLQTWLWPSHSWSSDGFINSKRRLLSLPYLSHTCIASGVMSFAVSILNIFSFELSSGTCQIYT